MVVKIKTPYCIWGLTTSVTVNRYVATTLCPATDYVFVFNPSLRTKNIALFRDILMFVCSSFVCLSLCLFVCDQASAAKPFVGFSWKFR